MTQQHGVSKPNTLFSEVKFCGAELTSTTPSIAHHTYDKESGGYVEHKSVRVHVRALLEPCSHKDKSRPIPTACLFQYLTHLFQWLQMGQ